jgi:hypothetical protein
MLAMLRSVGELHRHSRRLDRRGRVFLEDNPCAQRAYGRIGNTIVLVLRKPCGAKSSPLQRAVSNEPGLRDRGGTTAGSRGIGGILVTSRSGNLNTARKKRQARPKIKCRLRAKNGVPTASPKSSGS